MESIKRKYIPSKAYRYIPKDNQVIDLNKDLKKSMRKIFNTTNYKLFYKKHELDELEKFDIQFQDERLKNIPESEKLKFLQATGFDHKKSFDFLINNQNWKSQNLPIEYSKTINEILNIGFVYVHGRDHHFRPIIVMQIETYIKNKDKYSHNDWSKALLYFLEFIKANLHLPGQIEEWVCIVNMEKCSLFSIPDELKDLSKQMQDNYRCKLSALYIVGLTFVMRFLVNIVLSLVEETTKKKFKIVSDNKEIQSTININQIEGQFGGKSTLKSKIFPPEFYFDLDDQGCLPNDNYIISKDEYQLKISNNEIVSPDPDLCFEDELD